MTPSPQRTLIILNPHAGGGKAGQVWTALEPLLWKELGELIIAVTQHPQEVTAHLDQAYLAGVRRVISIGGDGTNHALVNALIGLNERNPQGERMVYGTLPIGTGRDWARGVGMPFKDPKEAAAWIARAQPQSLDIGRVHSESGDEYFLNIASTGLSGDVVARVNHTRTRRPWTFLGATVQSILRYQPQALHVRLDGETWYDDRAYVLVVANGTTFGHGMKIAPNAQVSDGLFDVLVIKAVPKMEILAALRRVYNGSHLTHPAVRHARAAQVEVQADHSVGIELDGEERQGSTMTFDVQPAALRMLV